MSQELSVGDKFADFAGHGKISSLLYYIIFKKNQQTYVVTGLAEKCHQWNVMLQCHIPVDLGSTTIVVNPYPRHYHHRNDHVPEHNWRHNFHYIVHGRHLQGAGGGGEGGYLVRLTASAVDTKLGGGGGMHPWL